MQEHMQPEHHSSHKAHVLFAILALLIGSVLGFWIGTGYQSSLFFDSLFSPNSALSRKDNCIVPNKSDKCTSKATLMPIDTTGWKIYKSPNNDFSIKYPQAGGEIEDNWIFEDKYGSVSFGYNSSSDRPSVDAARFLVINAAENTYASIDDWVKKVTVTDNAAGSKFSVKDVQVGGKPGKYVVGAGSKNGIGIIHNNKLYLIDFSCAFCNKQDDELYTKIYLTMVSTFEFVD